MFKKLLKVLGYVWAAPVTVFGLIYVAVMCLAGWYRWHGHEDDALVWLVNVDKIPGWLTKIWDFWGGHTVGNVVVLKASPTDDPGVLLHEQQHVYQCMVLGVFQPIMYTLICLTILACCRNAHFYYDSPFEIDARRGSKQLIDIVGELAKMKK
jgi:hypothetical protein